MPAPAIRSSWFQLIRGGGMRGPFVLPVRKLVIVLVALMLAGCLANTRFHKDSAVRPERVLRDDEGVLLLELVHTASVDGPALDHWESVSLVSSSERFDRDATVYVLGRVLEFDGEAAVFAGVLPAGIYRIRDIHAQTDEAATTRSRSVALPEPEQDIVVVAGTLNSLGVMVHAAIGNWVWWYRREPKFDLPGLVKRLRPELLALGAPLLRPDELKAAAEPDSRIRRAWPTTPVVMTSAGGALRGAQLGHIYYRQPPSGRDAAVWEVIDLDSYHAVVNVVPAGDRAFAVLAHGALFELDVPKRQANRLAANLPGRVVAAGLEGDTLYVVIEEHLPDESRRFTVRRRSGSDEWRSIGGAVGLPRPANSVLFSDGEVIISSGGLPHAGISRYLHRISLADGHVSKTTAPVQFVRRIGTRVLVGGSAPASYPADLHISHDNGRTWRKLVHMQPAGWPALDDEGTLLMPAVRITNEQRSIYLLRHEGLDYAKQDRWTELSRFPTRCTHFLDASVIDEKLVVFCGERVFQFEGPVRGWRKEALNEIQSALP